MNAILDLIIFSPDSEECTRRSNAFAEMGFSLRRCEDSNGLFNLFQARRAPLVLIEAQLSELCMALAGLRAMDTAAGIVAVSSFDSADNRILGLHCGADACFSPGVEDHEIAATLQALVRRAPPLRSPPTATIIPALPSIVSNSIVTSRSGKWQFQDAAWTLESPQGVRLPLTHAEREFLLKLTTSPHKRLPRADIANQDAPDGHEHVRRTDVLLSRLRRKAQDLAVELPVRTVWGWGYAFTAEL